MQFQDCDLPYSNPIPGVFSCKPVDNWFMQQIYIGIFPSIRMATLWRFCLHGFRQIVYGRTNQQPYNIFWYYGTFKMFVINHLSFSLHVVTHHYSADRDVFSSPSKYTGQVNPRNPAILISGSTSTGRIQNKAGSTSVQSFLSYNDDSNVFFSFSSLKTDNQFSLYSTHIWCLWIPF